MMIYVCNLEPDLLADHKVSDKKEDTAPFQTNSY